MTQNAGKYGKRPPKKAPALRLGPLLTGTIPEHPASADYLAAMNGGWDMLGNDQYGVCVPVTWANIRRLVTSTLNPPGYYPSLDDVITLYKTQNPGFPAEDNGCDVQTMLEYLTATGGPDGVKAAAFAAVDSSSPDEVKAAIALFGYVWTGINVSQLNQQEFAAGQPWDWDASSPVDGGHSIITGGYGTPGTGPLGGDERFITWATETSFTDAFWSNSVDECWAVIWPEHLVSREFMQGIDVNVLAADYQEITGRELPLPAPPAPAPPQPPSPPVPSPAPPGLLGELAEFIRREAASVDADISKVIAWLHERGL